MGKRETEGSNNGAGTNDFYGPSYFVNQMHGALQSAHIVLAVLFKIYRPRSVFDLGCGQGGWLAAAEALGAVKLVGVDGPWVDPAALISNGIEFSAVDLEKEFAVTEKYDLSISVEVAEHLSAGRSRPFVEALCAASDVVVFSAAIPQQGGVNHTNEQWQSFWAALFDDVGYECYDLFRPRLWRDKRVESWYRQNLFLYVRRAHPLTHELRSLTSPKGYLDIVHPEIVRRQSGEFQPPNRTTVTTVLLARTGTLVQKQAE